MNTNESCINWDSISAIATAIGVLITLAYTIVTYYLFKQNSNLITDNNKLLELNKETFVLNKKISQIHIYLELKKEFTSDFMTRFVSYLYQNSIKIIEDSSLKVNEGYKLHDNEMQVNRSKFVSTVLGNIEDLALLNEMDILTTEFINTGYGDLILTIGSSQIVKDLIKKVVNDSPGTCEGFRELYKKIYDLQSIEVKAHYDSELF